MPPVPTPDSYPGIAGGRPIYAGKTQPAGPPVPMPGETVTTLSLVNTSGSTQAENFVSPMFGMPFKAGDLPAGEYPVFALEDDTPCPATIYNEAAWSDGSKKFCGVFFRTPTSIAGSASLTVNINSGGSAPLASSRTLSDLTAADLSVELTGVTNLSGVWVASLNTAITDADEILEIGDGPAGKVWRIRAPFKQGGSPHGQLECWFYVMAAENSAGGLSHIACLPRVGAMWADVASPSATRLVLNCVLKSGASTLLTMTGHDTTETPGSNIALNHYSSFYVCDTDGLWNFVQGGGTTSARPTVRVQHDPGHIVRSRMVESYDTSNSPTSVASVNYVANCRGTASNRNLDSTGYSNFIGTIPSWCVTHLLTQSAVDERAVRVSSLAAAGFRLSARRSTTGQIIPCVDVAESYTGLGAIQTTWHLTSGFYTGMQTPAVTTSLWSGDTNTSHRGSFHYYAYLITGEPQYLDMLQETAAQSILQTAPGTYTRNVGSGITSLRDGPYTGLRDVKVGPSGATYKGAGLLFFGGGVRIAAWAIRDVVQAAAMSPDVAPDGADVKGYFTDVATQVFTCGNDLNSQMPTSWRDAGLWSTTQSTWNSQTNDTQYESPWMTLYLNLVSCMASQITEIPAAAAFRQHVAKWISSVHAEMDIACMASYRWRQWKGDATLVDSIGEVLFRNTATLTFDTSTDRATVSGTFGTWAPTNGDRFAFSTNLTANKPFAGAANELTLYAVNCSGQTFQLALTEGGSPIDVTNAVTITNFFAQLQNASPQVSFESGGTILGLCYQAAGLHQACGDSVVASARTQLEANVASAGVSFTADPRPAVASAFQES